MSASLPVLIIVTGPPAAGKTTLARRLGADLGIPLFTKDVFKEILFDRLGIGDTAWSQRIGVASFGLLYGVIRAEIAAGRTCMVEGNFDVDRSTEELARILCGAPATAIQLVCTARPQTLARRYRERARAGIRHPGHHGSALDDPAALVRRHGPMPLPNSRVIDVDLDRPDELDYVALIRAVSSCIDTATAESHY